MSNSLESCFLPFTPNRAFKKKPRLVTRAEGMYYFDAAGRKILDGFAGLWCVNAGHNHPKIIEAIKKQAAECDYAGAFMLAHPVTFAAAERTCAMMPGDIDHVFFTNSGSEAVETAVKIAVAYNRARGKTSKTKIIGRERGYHGVNIGGTSVGGIPSNRAAFEHNFMMGVEHLPHTFSLEKQAFSQGQPEWGGHLAEALENIVASHGADNIAAVFVEPVACSTGILVPPKGYLQKLGEICTRHDILLVFDEVITAFGRMGKATAAEYFGVQPDIICSAKGINSGAVPMGATFMRKGIHDALMQGGAYAIEFAHGYTYSGHPLACAAALAAQDVYRDEKLFERAAGLEKKWSDAMHALKEARHVIDIRAIGLMAGIEIDPGARDFPNVPSRAMEAFEKMYWEQDVVMRFTGNVLAFAPSLTVTESQIAEMAEKLKRVLESVK